MEKELLQKALDSLLHGSTQIVSEIDINGNLQNREVRINDLRVPLVNKLAEKLVQTEGFNSVLSSVFTNEVVKRIQEKVLENIRFQDLPYDVKKRIERDMESAELSVRRYKVIAEVVDEEPVK